MGDPFLSLIKTRCFTFSSSFSHIPSSTSRPFLRHNLRPRSPLRFPKPRHETTTSSSQFDLISTTECSDGSVVFRFGDETEKAAFDEARKLVEAELSRESNVEGSEVGASPASSPEENAVSGLSTAVLGDSSPSRNLQGVITKGKSHSKDVSGVSTLKKLEVQTLEGSERYPSTVSEDELIEGEAHRRDVKGTSTPMPVELHTSEVSEGYLSTKSEDELTQDKEDRLDVIGASTPILVELLAPEGSQGYPSTKSEDDLTDGKGDRKDFTGASTPTPVEFLASEGSEGYPSTKLEDELTEVKGDRTDITGASTPMQVELLASEGSEGNLSTKLEDESTEGNGDRTNITGASTPTPVELHTPVHSEGYLSIKSEDEVTKGLEHGRNVTGASTPTLGKEDRIDVTGTLTPKTVELHSVEGSEGYPSTKSGDEFTEGKAREGDVSGASIDRTAKMLTVEAAEEKVSINLDDEFAVDKVPTGEASAELIPKIVELHSVEGAKEFPLTESEDKSREVQEQRDVSGASTPRTVELNTKLIPSIVELHSVEGAEGYASTKLEDKFAEGKLDRADVLKAAPLGTVGLHTVEHGDTSLKKLEDEITEGKAHGSNGFGASTSRVVELHTVEGTERQDVSAPSLLLSTGAASLPHPSKALTGGEDAYFVSSGTWLGLADGASHWSLEGINPGLYAHELMENCERFLSDCKGIPLAKPEDVLVRGAAQTNSPGSSTVLVAYFDGQALHVANIGNSGFIIIRNGAVFKRSAPLIHGFNFPLQILRGVDPSELIERYCIDLDEEDVIVTATDGLFDNLYEQEITSIVIKSFQKRMKLQDIAKFLATSAQEVGQSTTRRSPFADAVETSGYVGYTGGKLDDVTVIVSHVQKKCSCYSQ